VTELRTSDLRHRLTLEELSRVADEGGGFTESWVTVATLSADLRPISGDERLESDRLTGTITHEIVLPLPGRGGAGRASARARASSTSSR
jgi:head-tail adaptor